MPVSVGRKLFFGKALIFGKCFPVHFPELAHHCVGQAVGVNVHGCLHAAVAENGLQGLIIHPLLDAPCGEAVAECVEGEVLGGFSGRFHRFTDLAEVVVDASLIDGPAKRCCKDQRFCLPRAFPAVASRLLPSLLLIPTAVQQFLRPREHGNDPS